MTTKLFITGATGYIGGSALAEITSKHPDWDYTCMVRNSDKGAKIVSVYPQIKLVYGDLSSSELIEEEASKADIIYHFANADDEPSARAIGAGLSRRTATTPGFWIHVSGSLIIGWETVEKECYGELTSKVYNDWDGIGELTSLPDSAAHRNIDKIVLNASRANPEKVKTAIVCPCVIYGKGSGPDRTRSTQLPTATSAFLKHQKAFMVGKGENVWHQVHILDLARLFLLLGEAAVNGGPPATWNDQGYYLAENGSLRWGDALRAVAKECRSQGLLKSADVASLTSEEADTLFRAAKLLVGTNSRGESIRAKRLLGWEPKEPKYETTLPDLVKEEAVSLDLIQGHAEKVEQ